jgi:hypothetical protein
MNKNSNKIGLLSILLLLSATNPLSAGFFSGMSPKTMKILKSSVV